MNDPNKFDIIIPVFQEDESIKITVKNIINKVTKNIRILICYDYDEDPTLKILKDNFPNNKKIYFIKNKSQGFNSAIITGIENSSADAVLIYMADDHENFNIIDKIFEKYNEGYQVVCPSRFMINGKMDNEPLIKGFLSKIASFLLYNLTSWPIKDSTNAFRLFSNDLLKKIKFESTIGFTLSFEITAKAHRLNYKMIEIPMYWKERISGESRFKLFTFIPYYLKWFIYIFNTSIFKK